MPRPKISPDRHRQQLSITLPPDLIGTVKGLAEISGISVSSWIENLLRRDIEAARVAIEQKARKQMRICGCGRECGSKGCTYVAGATNVEAIEKALRNLKREMSCKKWGR